MTGKNHFKTNRSAGANGWFSYTMKVTDKEPLYLICNYWGGGWGTEPAGMLDIFVDSAKIATQDLSDKTHPTVFYNAIYSIPLNLTKGKSLINLRFQPKWGAITDGVYECKIATAEGLSHRDLLKEQ